MSINEAVQGRKCILLKPKQIYKSSLGNEEEACCLSVCSENSDRVTPSKPYRIQIRYRIWRKATQFLGFSLLSDNKHIGWLCFINFSNTSWNVIGIFTPKCDILGKCSRISCFCRFQSEFLSWNLYIQILCWHWVIFFLPISFSSMLHYPCFI